MSMAAVQRMPAALSGLARQFARTRGNTTLAGRAMRIARDHAADEQLALATLLKLAEESPASMREALADRELARDLVFCLGASEIVAGEMSQAGAEWLRVFASARGETIDTILAAMRCEPDAFDTRADAARILTRFYRGIFLRIAIADLT